MARDASQCHDDLQGENHASVRDWTTSPEGAMCNHLVFVDLVLRAAG